LQRTVLPRLAALAALAALALAPAARAQGPLEKPQMALGAQNPAGDEKVLVDLAVIPSQYYRRDLNGVLLPGGFRLGTWANLASRSFAGGKARLVTSFRFDYDSSATANERAAFPTLTQTSSALLAAYLELDVSPRAMLRAGRQFHADAADYLAFDGVKLLLTLPLALRLEVYGGTRTSTVITQGQVSSSLYELDGVATEQGVQPLVGAVVRYAGDLLHRREASLGFRQSWRTPGDDRLVDPLLPDSLTTTAQELVASAGTDAGPLHLSGALGYELLLARVMRARLTAALSLPAVFGATALLAGSTLAVEYRRHRPTFALDSIFNYFALNPYDEGSVALGGFAGARGRFDLRVYARRFLADTEDRNGNPVTVAPDATYAKGGRATVVHQLGPVLVDGVVSNQWGYGGQRLLVDAGARRAFLEAFEVYGRLSFSSYAIQDKPNSNARSYGAVLGATYYLPVGASVSAIVEEIANPGSVSPNAVNGQGGERVQRFMAIADLARWL
jgi:hypothetical protein